MGTISNQHRNEILGNVLSNPACWPRVQLTIAEKENKTKASKACASSESAAWMRPPHCTAVSHFNSPFDGNRTERYAAEGAFTLRPKVIWARQKVVPGGVECWPVFKLSFSNEWTDLPEHYVAVILDVATTIVCLHPVFSRSHTLLSLTWFREFVEIPLRRKAKLQVPDPGSWELCEMGTTKHYNGDLLPFQLSKPLQRRWRILQTCEGGNMSFFPSVHKGITISVQAWK